MTAKSQATSPLVRQPRAGHTRRRSMKAPAHTSSAIVSRGRPKIDGRRSIRRIGRRHLAHGATRRIIACAQRMLWPVFFQSARNVSRPLSVSGCLTRLFRIAGGTVATSAPASAACLTWSGVRIEAARISVFRRVVIVVDRADLADQLHAVEADVVEPADEGRDEGGAGLGGEQRLVGREAEGDVDHVPSLVSVWQAFSPSQVSGTLTATFLAMAPRMRALAHHAVELGRGHFGGDRARHDRADLGDHLLDRAGRPWRSARDWW